MRSRFGIVTGTLVPLLLASVQVNAHHEEIVGAGATHDLYHSLLAGDFLLIIAAVGAALLAWGYWSSRGD
jgi:hypothetical protein